MTMTSTSLGTLRPATAVRLAVQAYVCLYPLVRMEVIRRQQSASGVPHQGDTPAAPANHVAPGRSHALLELDGLNSFDPDTLLTSAWLDLTAGPIIVSSDHTHGRHYVLPMMDMWTEVFASPGTRTHGNVHAAWAVLPPGWSGYVPPVARPVQAPTEHVWLLGRVQTVGPRGRLAGHEPQDPFHITPLTRWMLPSFRPTPPAAHANGTRVQTLRSVESMDGVEFFRLALKLLDRHAVQPGDEWVLGCLQRLDMEVGGDLTTLSPTVLAAVTAAPARGLALIRSSAHLINREVNGWQMMDAAGVTSDRHLVRAVAAMTALGAGLSEDLLSLRLGADAHSQPLTGAKRYVLHFDKDQLPQVDAFWSLTVPGYSGPADVMRAGPMMGPDDGPPLNDDGSLDILLQHSDPGASRRKQWLPTPPGPFTIDLRLYSPTPAALHGRWSPPRAVPS